MPSIAFKHLSIATPLEEPTGTLFEISDDEEKTPSRESSDEEDFADTFEFQSVDEYLAKNRLPETTPPAIGKKKEIVVPTEPVVVSTSITTTHVKNLYELCQSHIRLKPIFEIVQQKPSEFGVVMRLVGGEEEKEFRPEETFPSKKHAKERAAAMAVEYVKALPKSTPTSITGSAPPGVLLDASDEKENWVGMLNNHCMVQRSRPQYTDYATPDGGFSCEIKLPTELGLPGVDEKVFGDKHKAFKNKKSAKTLAAKEAMTWITETQLKHPDTPPPEKSKLVVLGCDNGKAKPKPTGEAQVVLSKDSSTTHAISVFCKTLGIRLPEYNLKPDIRSQGVYDVSAIVKRDGPAKDVLIGPLKNRYGKKKAKEEMGLGVLSWLFQEARKANIKVVGEDGVEFEFESMGV